MTNKEAIEVLKIELNKARSDFYPDRRKAIELAINALYGLKRDRYYAYSGEIEKEG